MSLSMTTETTSGQRKIATTLGALCLAVAVVMGTSCGDGGTIVKGPQPGLRFISGTTGTDTIEATLSKPLVLELRDESSKIIANRTVRIVPQNAIIKLTGTSSTFAVLNVPTDENGRVSIDVTLGTLAGPAAVFASVAVAMGIVSAQFVVSPGAPTHATLQPRDTAAYPAARVAFRVAYSDRYRNATTTATPVSFAANNDLTVASNGVATPRLPGRDTIIARTASFADTVFLTALPTTGTLLGYFGSSATPSLGLAVMNLDGSGYKELAKNLPRSQPYFLYRAKFMIDGKSLIVRVVQDSASRMWIVPFDGSVPHIFLKTSISTNENMNAPSPDGKFVYLVANGVASQLRANVDGAGVVPVPAEIPGPAPFADDPAISSDGVWMPYKYNGNLRTRNIATGVRTAFNPREGFFPAWAPTGTRFAWTNGMGGTLFTSEHDGSDTRVISSDQWLGPLSWTTDGKYLLGYHIVNPSLIRPDLIDVATGAIYPLPFKTQQDLVLQPVVK